MRRGEIRYALLDPPSGRRPVLIVAEAEMIPALNGVMCVPITSTLLGIRTRVPLGPEEGLRRPSEAACDQIALVEKVAIDSAPIGALGKERIAELDQALAYALGIRKENLA